MRFHAPPALGNFGGNYGGHFAEYYGEPPVNYGHYAEPPYGYGFYGEPPEGYGYYGEEPYLAEDPYGYYAEPEFAGYGEPYYYGQVEPGYSMYEPVGYYAEEAPLAGYGNSYGNSYVDGYGNGYGGYGEAYPVAGYANGYGGYGQSYPMGQFAEDPYAEYEPMGYYGQTPEMPGYAEQEPLAEDYPLSGGVSYYGEPEFAGYVRDAEPRYNAGCPLPTNVNGFGGVGGYEGYTRPEPVNPNCTQFTEQPGPTPGTPDSFKPLW